MYLSTLLCHEQNDNRTHIIGKTPDSDGCRSHPFPDRKKINMQTSEYVEVMKDSQKYPFTVKYISESQDCVNVGQLKSIRSGPIMGNTTITDMKCIKSDPNQNGNMRFKLQFGNNWSKSRRNYDCVQRKRKSLKRNTTSVELLEITLKNP